MYGLQGCHDEVHGNTPMSQYIVPDKMMYLVIGDGKTQLQQINQLSLAESVLLDTNGNMVKEIDSFKVNLLRLNFCKK